MDTLLINHYYYYYYYYYFPGEPQIRYLCPAIAQQETNNLLNLNYLLTTKEGWRAADLGLKRDTTFSLSDPPLPGRNL